MTEVPSDRNDMDATAPLAGKVALVAGATRGAGRAIAVELARAGATVYATGRSTRSSRSEYNRPETIEETAELIAAAGGEGIALRVDHLEPEQVAGLVQRIDSDHGRLDILVNDIWGAEKLFDWNAKLWEHDLDNGLRLLRLAVETHLITSHHALPLLVRRPGGLVVEMTDGTADYNAVNYRVSAFYDLAKASILRLAWSQGHELAEFGATAVALTPGWMRSEIMLENRGVTEANWNEGDPGHFGISETPTYTGRAVAALAADPDVARWNRASLSSGQLAQEYGFTDVDGSTPDAWRYLVEVQDPGKPPDPTRYR
jgi:NAD(P)-dependent dehydrogenase (short-subunit alcohol dehydrogenase family)